MKKEIQAAEWVLILAGIILLLYGSKYISFFARIFQVYFLLFTVGLTIWMGIRYRKRYKKANIVVFPLKTRDELTQAVTIKNLQLLVIVTLSAGFFKEWWMFLAAGACFLFFVLQTGRLGRPKFVFHQAQLHRDALFFQKINPQSILLTQNGIIINTDEGELPVLFEQLDGEGFIREVEFEENQILDDVLLMGEHEEVASVFINEIVQFAEKMGIPIEEKEGIRPHE